MNNFSVAELEENANICILNLHFLRVQWLAEKKDNNYTNSTRNTGEKEAIFFFLATEKFRFWRNDPMRITRILYYSKNWNGGLCTLFLQFL